MVNRANGTRANGHRANGNRADVVAPIYMSKELYKYYIDIRINISECQMNLVLLEIYF